MRQKFHKFIDFSVTFILYWVAAVGLHEMAHALTGQALGWTASVSYPSPFAGWVSFPQWQQIPFIHVVLIAFAGGATVCVLYLILSHYTEDWETDMVLWFFAPMHGIYAIFEVGYIMHVIPIWVLASIPVLPAVIIWMLKLKHEGRI